MRYVMRSGVLYREPNCPLARLKGSFIGMEKQVYRNDGSLAMKTLIRRIEVPNTKQADVRTRAYVMLDAQDREIAVARPDYAEGDDPTVVGWPICRMPRADHAALELHGGKYTLVMHNCQNYILRDAAGSIIVQIMHRGLTGGWNVEADKSLAPEILCGLFVFCRYLEQENELLVV